MDKELREGAGERKGECSPRRPFVALDLANLSGTERFECLKLPSKQGRRRERNQHKPDSRH